MEKTLVIVKIDLMLLQILMGLRQQYWPLLHFGLVLICLRWGCSVANNISNYTNGTISPSNILGLTSASLSTLAAIGVVVAAPGAVVAVA
jgi:hypothetical protein